MALDDFDVALIRHLLIEAASAMKDNDLKRSIASWTYVGNGVWTGVDEAVLIGRSDAFESAAEVLKIFGEEIPLEYLKERIRLKGCYWNNAQRSERILGKVKKLGAFFASAA